MPNNKEKNEDNYNLNYNKKITSNKNINSYRHSLILNNNKLTINPTKEKCKSIKKFLINKNSSKEKNNNDNKFLISQDNNEISPDKIERSKRLSIYKSSKANRYSIKSNLPYVSTLASQINTTTTTTKKESNNFVGINNITPLVLPFIGLKQDEKKSKMI